MLFNLFIVSDIKDIYCIYEIRNTRYISNFGATKHKMKNWIFEFETTKKKPLSKDILRIKNGKKETIYINLMS